MTPRSSASRSGLVGAVRRLLVHRRQAPRLMLGGVGLSFVVLAALLITTSSAVAWIVFVALILTSCFASCVIIWRISEHDAAALEGKIAELRDRGNAGGS